ncbi:hypothetical protein [Oceanibaculum indicum]|uniref:Uncharacterized protein n=1 Tax=Oceanibaculum indicum P24 TaxID=1207063 RepID=K2J7J3_9PROT|nr:hypothetical protein [Oceanibaculum indicum]EKE70897.1 hypothetical protein P24_15179 [Oceanibaculum indicum P24]
MAIWLVEIDLVKPDGSEETVRFSCPEIVPFAPDDPDRPNIAYDPDLIEPANLDISLPRDPDRGIGEIGGGAVVISNAGGRYGWMLGCGAKAVRSLVGPDDAAAYSDFTKILDGQGGAIEVDSTTARPGRIIVPVADARLLLDAYAQDVRYSGDPLEDYEGTADDLAEAPKPLGLGDLSAGNVPGPVVATAPHIVYQLSEDGFSSLDGISAAGGDAALVDGGDLSGSAFDAAVPDSGEYVTDAARGLVKLADTPSAELTFDFTGPAGSGLTALYGAALDTPPALLEWLLRKWGVPGSKIGSSFAGIDVPVKVGIWLGTQDVRRRELVELLCRSFLGWCLPDGNDVWQVGRIALPAGSPDAILRDADVFGLEPDGWGYPIPISGATVLWGRNYREMRGNEVAGAVRESDPARAAWLAERYRRVHRDSPAGVLAAFPSAQPVTLETVLTDGDDAAALAEAAITAFGGPRRPIRISTPLTDATRALRPGGLVQLDTGLDGSPEAGAGELAPWAGLYRVTGILPTQPGLGMVTLRLWGAVPTE